MPTSILYVDDEPDLELLISSKYQKQIRAGERVCEFARSGAEALARVEARTVPYDVIVVDISMPKMSGLELLDALEQREVATPVIIVSAYADIANIRAAMNRGAFDFLTKPVDLDDLELTQQKAVRHFDTLRRAKALDRAYFRPELAALGLLVAGVAHDLKNPLGFVSTFTELALELLGELDETVQEEAGQRCEAELADDVRAELDAVRETLTKVTSHAAWALELVGSLLTSAGSTTREVELNPLVSHHVDLFASSSRADAPELGLTIDKQLDEGVGIVELAPTRIVSVVINLLENAYHAVRDHAAAAAPGYRPRIVVETRAIDDDTVELSVSDNGPGVASEHREQIFEPFFTTKPTGQGTGLGLHVVGKIAGECGGSVVAEDGPDGGARLRVRLPRRPASGA
jgi:signal transduction histidine kinase